MAAAGPRLGVLGGSFDPPHLAHLAIASEAAEELGLERVLFVPAAAPPHKDSVGRTSASVRLEMAELAVQSDPRFVASGIEIDEGLVYTHETLAAVSRRFLAGDSSSSSVRTPCSISTSGATLRRCSARRLSPLRCGPATRSRASVLRWSGGERTGW